MGWIRSRVKGVLLAGRHRRNESTRRRLGQDGGGLPPGLWGLGIGPGGHLSFDGIDCVELARIYGTPLHVVLRSRLASDFDRFAKAFSDTWPNVAIGYSYKTNPLPGVIAELHALGAWAEVISEFELWLALRLGVAPERIIYNGPAKPIGSLALALRTGIGLINVDNDAEIEHIGRLRDVGKARQRIGVRVVTSVGWSGQFGYSIRNGEARAAFAKLCRMEHVEASGVHVHLGTGLRDVPTYLQAIKEVLEFARSIEQEFDVSFRYYDFGGGFGVPTVRPYSTWDERLMANGYPPAPLDTAEVPDIKAFAEPIVGLLRERYGSVDRSSAPRLIFEPGRALASSAQTLLLGAIAVKPGIGGTIRVILDGGRNIALPTGYELHELLPASAMNARCEGAHSFFGPLCHPGDVLMRAKQFPLVTPGDLVALMDAGAYFIPNQMNFSNPRPAVVMVDGGSHRLIRKRESFDDIVQLDHFGEHDSVMSNANTSTQITT